MRGKDESGKMKAGRVVRRGRSGSKLHAPNSMHRGERLWLPGERREPGTPTPLVVAMVICAVPAAVAIIGSVCAIYNTWAIWIGAR